MKRTHKLKALKDVAAIVGAASSLSEAAKTLGVNRSTLHRWMKAGKVAGPKVPARAPQGGRASSVPPVTSSADADAWAAAAREGRDDPTDLKLIDLARQALELSAPGNHPAIRLQAMGKFQALVRQLDAGGEPAAAEPKPARPRLVPRTGMNDPRDIWKAAK